MPALALLSLSVVLTLKLISHAHVMNNVYHIIERLRTIGNKNSKENIPENELSPEVYFILAFKNINKRTKKYF